LTAVVLAGGGLANALIAWRLGQLRPEVDITVLERGERLGGNHTWSFHGSDLTDAQREWLAPLVAHSWPSQRVRFPAFERRLGTSYHSLTAERLHATLAARFGARIRTGITIAEVGPRTVSLAGGEALPADLVLDGRGAPPLEGFDLAWQKFVGLEVETTGPHGCTEPLLMDATVEQLDGYRFVYVLPLGPTRLLIEDTRYSDGPAIDAAAFRDCVRDYAARRGWLIASVVREETGCLPIVLAGDPVAYWRAAGVAVPRTGMRALLFHHTTGYSLPDAVRLADTIAALPTLESRAVASLVRETSLARWRAQGMFRLLNRLMFEAARPAERYRTLQHFYRLSEPLVRRFYAGQLHGFDAPRLLIGRPPVPVSRALVTMARTAFSRRAPVTMRQEGRSA
jgi:lycopene beta-cyclase